MHSNQFDLLAQEISRPVDALGLLMRALRHRTCGREADIILDEVELGLGEVRRQLTSVLDLARAEHCLASFERTEFRLAAVLDKLALQTNRVVYDTGTRLWVVPTGASVLSDISALEIILRSLLVAALHFAAGGRVLVGARPCGDEMQVQVWAKPDPSETGIRPVRFAPQEHSAEPPALALEVARTLAQGLGHELHLRPSADGGAVFSISVPRAPGAGCPEGSPARAPEECA